MGFATPDMESSIPLSRVPEKSLPVATSPAWGSTEMSVTMKAMGPAGSQDSIDL